MWLLKFHEHQEFHHFKVSNDVEPLRRYVEQKWKGITFKQLPSVPPMIQVFENGEEIGFIGEVEVLSFGLIFGENERGAGCVVRERLTPNPDE